MINKLIKSVVYCTIKMMNNDLEWTINSKINMMKRINGMINSMINSLIHGVIDSMIDTVKNCIINSKN